MANVVAPSFIRIFTVLFIAMLVYSENQYYYQPKEVKMTVFLQEFRGGPNIAAVAGMPGKPRTHSQFGTVFVDNVLLTEGESLRSPKVGRVQGISFISSLNAVNGIALASLVFTNKYNGSTLEIQGRGVQIAQVRELSVVSGTGKFRFAKGYATFETVFQLPLDDYVVIRCNITVRQ